MVYALTCIAQNKLNDINRIVLNAYIPEQKEPIPDQAKSLLENKLSQIVCFKKKVHTANALCFNRKKAVFIKIDLLMAISALCIFSFSETP